MDINGLFARVRTLKSLSRVLNDTLKKIGYTNFELGYLNLNNQYVRLASNFPDSLSNTIVNEGYAFSEIARCYLAMDKLFLRYADIAHYQINNPYSALEKEQATNLTELLGDHGFFEIYTYRRKVSVDDFYVSIFFSITIKDYQALDMKMMFTNRRDSLGLLMENICAVLPVLSQFENINGSINTLTKKQQQVLIALGRYSLTQQQTGLEVGLTESTVKTYCKIIKQKLAKRTLAGAVYEGVRLGLIPMDK